MALLLLLSCQDAVEGEGKSGKVNVSIIRFDQMLNDYVEFNSFLALQRMKTECPSETKLLVEDIIGLGEVSDDQMDGKLKVFFSDSTLRVLMKDALVKFGDMNGIERQFDKGFAKLKEEVPSMRIPLVYSQFSALNESVVVTDSLLGFSIDKYMGEDYPLYKRYYYDYQCRSMNPNRIVPDCFTFYLMSEYPFPTDGRRCLLDIIMHLGKIHYVVARILDYESQEKELGYKAEEVAWCKENKKAVWQYVRQHGHLYATDPMVIRNYTKAAPYTSFFGEGSPAMLGVWLGTHLVDAYMKKNRDVTIQDLLECTDYRQMLADSNFKF